MQRLGPMRLLPCSPSSRSPRRGGPGTTRCEPLGRPPAATLAMGGAFLLGSIGTTVGAILAYELHHGDDESLSLMLTPLEGGVFATCGAGW